MTHEEKIAMRQTIYQHLGMLLDKVHRLFETGELTPAQMSLGGDLLKDIAKADSALAKSCYYESQRDYAEDKKY